MADHRAPILHSRIEPLLRPIAAFLSAESAGGIVLIAFTLAALIWRNSPWGDTYEHFWECHFSLTLGSWALSLSLEQWVNDCLMVLFFLLVGLEIKRELIIGELASFSHAVLPVCAAIGGMVVPAGIYALINARGSGATGWAIPMATDIAFAVGVIALVGRGLPTSVKVLLLAVAIVDDLGSVIVIALFYTSTIHFGAMLIAGIIFLLLILLNVLRVHSPLPYILLGAGLWLATLFSGVHATVAGVLLAFTIPASRQIEEQPYIDYIRSVLREFEADSTTVPDQITESQSHAIKAMEEASQAVQTPLARVEHALLIPVNFIIVPLFALANAGVSIRFAGEAIVSPVAWGVLLGLLIGKPIGILLACWIAVKTRIATLPDRADWRQVAGVAILCGIGFTMSLFITTLAFAGKEELFFVTKVGILTASILAGIIGALVIKCASGTPAQVR